MSNIPDFATAAYPEVKAGGQSPAPRTETWVTNEQIPVPPTYSESVYDDCLHLDFTAGVAPNLRGPYATMYVARPWTVRQYAGFLHGGGIQRLLPPQPGGRAEGAFHRLRPGDAPRL